MKNQTITSAQRMIDACWALTILFAVGICVSMIPEGAFANSLDTVFCAIVDMIQGKTGKAVATIAVVTVGVGALLGKISWGMALIVATGIAIVFGAGTIIDTISGNTAGAGC